MTKKLLMSALIVGSVAVLAACNKTPVEPEVIIDDVVEVEMLEPEVIVLDEDDYLEFEDMDLSEEEMVFDEDIEIDEPVEIFVDESDLLIE